MSADGTSGEPTFTLAEIHEAFGFNFTASAVDEGDPLVFARNALDDARRTMRLLEEMCVGNVDLEPMQDVLCNAGKRVEVANSILDRFARPAREKMI